MEWQWIIAGGSLLLLATVDNNDTVSYGCIRVALELQPSERKMQPS